MMPILSITTKFHYNHVGLAPDTATGSGHLLMVVTLCTGCVLLQLAGMHWRLGSCSASGIRNIE
jgi:hypothetical protein